MTLVAIETSVRAASVAVQVGTRRSSRVLDEARAHARDLVPALSACIQEVGSDPSDVEAVLVGTGPGSYTGLRVGVATALGLARGSGARLRGEPSIDLLAYDQLAPGAECIVLLDARGGKLYHAHLVRTEDDVRALRPPSVVAPEDLDALLPGDVPIFGDASVAKAAALSEARCKRLRTDVRPRAEALLELGRRRLEREGPMLPEAVRPLYLRPFEVSVRRSP